MIEAALGAMAEAHIHVLEWRQMPMLGFRVICNHKAPLQSLMLIKKREIERERMVKKKSEKNENTLKDI